ncbi:MAG: PAS domain S-box protein [Candidatus Delongbacteria bacterium]|nr:PAS domain S-box protein [Candidatus Delongbacteria bacterium]
MIYIQLIYNLSMLIALSVLSGFVGKKEKIGQKQKSILQGVIFGMVAVVGMLIPVKYAPGIIFDGRSVVISLCALFFGPVSATISAALPAVLRVFQGGIGTLPGVLVIVESAMLGLLFHYFIYKKKNTAPLHILFLMGMLVHITMVLLMLTLPADIAWDVVKSIGLPVISVYPAATILIGKIISDSLEKTQFLAAIKESEEKYRVLIENSHDIIYTLSSEGIFTFVSPAWTRLLGHPTEQVLNHSFQPFVHPEDLPACMKFLQSMFSAKPENSVIDYRVKHSDGSWRWHSTKAVSLRDNSGNISGFLGIARDISDIKMVESTLIESEEKFKSAVNQMKLGMAVHEMIFNKNGDPVDYRFTEVNPEFEKMTGLKKNELIGRTCLDVLPKTEKFWIGTYGKVTKEGVSVTFENYASLLKKWFRVYAYKTRENEFAVVFDNITERKKNEEALNLKIKELNEMNSVMVGREIKMTELKEEINGLLKELGREKKY